MKLSTLSSRVSTPPHYLRLKHEKFFKTLPIVFRVADYVENDICAVRLGLGTFEQCWRQNVSDDRHQIDPLPALFRFIFCNIHIQHVCKHGQS